MSFEFVPATKAGSKARIALMGTAGSGKTWSALSIAAGLDRGASAIGLIDTDRRQALKYADRFGFLWLGMSSYSPEDLARATIAAAEQEVGTLILDTWSPFWSGPDGMLDRVGQAASNFEGWRQARPAERLMFDALFGYPGHVIVTLRQKTEYVVERNEHGKMEPKRVGLKPEQRDGIEHEFDVVLDLSDAGQAARVAKTRCPELAGRTFTHPGEEVGEIIQAWLSRGAIGDPLNPQQIRDWALGDGREFAELKERRDALAAAGQLDAIVYGRDGSSLVAVGSLLTDLARDLLKQEALVGAAGSNGRRP